MDVLIFSVLDIHSFSFFFCVELHCNFILHIIFVNFVSYCITFNLIVRALYEYFHEAKKDHYYYCYLNLEIHTDIILYYEQTLF